MITRYFRYKFANRLRRHYMELSKDGFFNSPKERDFYLMGLGAAINLIDHWDKE